MQEVNTLRRRHERMEDTVYGVNGSGGLADVVKEISVTLQSLEKMFRFVAYFAVPFSVLAMFVAFTSMVVSIIALSRIP